VLFVKSETERPHEPQLGTGGDTGPPDIPRVLWNVGLVQDDVEDWFGLV
jgi:hypothetical protein